MYLYWVCKQNRVSSPSLSTKPLLCSSVNFYFFYKVILLLHKENKYVRYPGRHWCLMINQKGISDCVPVCVYACTPFVANNQMTLASNTTSCKCLVELRPRDWTVVFYFFKFSLESFVRRWQPTIQTHWDSVFDWESFCFWCLRFLYPDWVEYNDCKLRSLQPPLAVLICENTRTQRH